MNNEIGSASVSEKYKKISDESCSELCILLNALTTKCAVLGNVIPAMNESVVYESGVQKGDLPRIIEAWIEAEDDPVVIASEVEDMIIELDTSLELENEEVEEAINVEAEAPVVVSWTDCLASFETIRCFLRTSDMKTLAFESVVESIRTENQDRATSQLSIKSFFAQK